MQSNNTCFGLQSEVAESRGKNYLQLIVNLHKKYPVFEDTYPSSQDFELGLRVRISSQDFESGSRVRISIQDFESGFVVKTSSRDFDSQSFPCFKKSLEMQNCAFPIMEERCVTTQTRLHRRL